MTTCSASASLCTLLDDIKWTGGGGHKHHPRPRFTLEQETKMEF